MHIKHHLRFSAQLYNFLETSYNIHLDKKYFIFGSVAPDLPFFEKQVRHVNFECLDRISDLLNIVLKDINEVYSNKASNKTLSFHLGLLTHYLCDSFCYVHNYYSLVTKLEHYSYEKKLDKVLKNINTETLNNYFINATKKIQSFHINDLLKYFKWQHVVYMN